MKKLIVFLVAFAMIVNLVPIRSSAMLLLDHNKDCILCKANGDFDQNGSVDADDAIHLLFYVMFPERYSLPEHVNHTEVDCDGCLIMADLDQNGSLDIDDAIYLLFYSMFPTNYPLPGCSYEYTLSVGYGRADITPEGTMEIYSSTASSAHDPLQITCTAVHDGTETALLFSLDLRNLSEKVVNQWTDIIAEKFNIPADHIMFNITHTHSAPSSSDSTAAGLVWRAKICERLVTVVQDALDDMDEVKGVYMGKSHTESITFVRRYLMPDGSYKTNPTTGTATAHESEADNEMRTIRIDRKNKKDVLMVNYQTHYGSATALYKGQYSADFVHVFREEAEKKWDCHFVYHSGASGNLNFASAIKGEKKYSTFVEATKEGFIPTVQDCISTEEGAKLGKLKFASSRFEAPVYQDTREDYLKALEINSSGYDSDSEEYEALLKKHGLTSRQVQGIITRSKLGETVELPFFAITFGDIAFVSSPYEMFDTNGVQVREGSPFKMTFVLSYTNGGFGYVPSSLAFPHGGYEVYVSRFCENTGDDCADEMVRLLKLCYTPEKKTESNFGILELF